MPLAQNFEPTLRQHSNIFLTTMKRFIITDFYCVVMSIHKKSKFCQACFGQTVYCGYLPHSLQFATDFITMSLLQSPHQAG